MSSAGKGENGLINMCKQRILQLYFEQRVSYDDLEIMMEEVSRGVKRLKTRKAS